MAERQTILGLLKNILHFDPACDRLAAEIERSCYAATRDDCPGEVKWTDRFTAAYSAIAYRVGMALVNGDLVARLIAGEIDVARIAYMTAEELDPSANEVIRAEIALRSVQKIERRICTMYICPRCGLNETDGGQEQQRRAADEGTSLNIQCLNTKCEHRWRIG